MLHEHCVPNVVLEGWNWEGSVTRFQLLVDPRRRNVKEVAVLGTTDELELFEERRHFLSLMIVIKRKHFLFVVE